MPRGARSALLLAAAVGLTWLGACRSAAVPPVAPPEAARPAPAPAPPPPPEVAPEEGGEGTFALEEPFTGVAAARLATASDRLVRSLAFHGLTRLDTGGRPEPELAVKWEAPGDGLQWTFHLRPDIAFSDGRYLEARHVVASWERLVAAPSARYAWLLSAVKGFEEVRSGSSVHLAGLILVDGLTLRVELDRPQPDLPVRLAHPALGISAFGEDETGIGPFEVWGTPEPARVTLRSNPEYFRGLPHLDELTFVRGEAADETRMATGALDGAVTASGRSPGPTIRLFTHAVPRRYVLGLNRAVPPFSRESSVRAFLGSLDRSALEKEVGGGHTPATLVDRITAGAGGAVPGSTGAGTAGVGRIDLVHPDADRTAASLARSLQAVVQKAGGRVVLHAVRVADLSGVLARREYHVFLVPYLPSTPDPRLEYEELVGWNRSIPADLTGTLQGLLAAPPAEQLSALANLDRALQEGGYLVPLVSVDRRFLLTRSVCGIRPDPLGNLDWARVWRSRRADGKCD